jgi:hydrophobic/amphiphilic exporter-1 (mainly G- bacteria), HAE1 family
MRQALGTAVFTGMLGVTLFGLFLTPVFYVAVRSVVLATSRRRPVKRSELGGTQPFSAE